ncbi:MAG: hypothetical protein U0527_13340 [Candidatus Eisenbacteria bacterium]
MTARPGPFASDLPTLSAPRRAPRAKGAASAPVWGWVAVSAAIFLLALLASRLWPGDPLASLERAVELERTPEIEAR